MSTLNVNNIAPESGSTITIGGSGDTITVPSGATLSGAGAITVPSGGSLTINSGATLSGAGAITVPSGGSLTIDSGGTVTNNGTSTGFGKLVQIVSADHYTPGSTSSTSFVNTGLSLAITPTSASNKVLVLASGMGEAGSGCTIAFRVYRDAVAIGMTSGPSSNGAGASRCAISISNLDSPATTSTLTYHVKFRKVSGASNAVWNPGSEGGSITLMEVVA
jgi:autotransporter passenger strand-loop-strand repeat protein